ncbi:hypothetical protein K5X82_14300 [Halosquirtibacter xylanolyticus]|uniref:hypothetical protein n=1 Tax=Halosquirtibacter xylanolyticus TaxID=3374599 RepID=UPI0037489600|nr:hypothetical protein K5X82_14300 [Prolixibacteraceae bacterium]
MRKVIFILMIFLSCACSKTHYMTEEEAMEAKVLEVIRSNNVTGVVIVEVDQLSWDRPEFIDFQFPSSGTIEISNCKIKVEGKWYNLLDISRMEVQDLQNIRTILLYYSN